MDKSLLRENGLVVTGAQGRIGQLLRHLWAGRGVVWSGRKRDLVWDMGAGVAPDLPPGTRVLHLAGTTGGDLSQNARAARALAGVLRPGHRLVLISSIAVYGPGAGPFSEATPPAPASAYASAKLQVETILAPHRPMVLRLGNLFGADALTRQALAGPVTLDQAGPRGPMRSWIGPLTFADALWRLVQDPAPGLWNLAQAPALGMADILTAMGAGWTLGPRAAPVPHAEMEVSRLGLPPASAAGLVAELASLKGIWP